MKKYIGYFILFATFIIFMTGCADVTNIEKCVTVEPYGFWSGLWHGLIAFFSFFGSLFSDEIAVYAVNNNGGWYDFGFVLGSGILGFGASSSTKRN
jgi:hypothetical protein